MEYKRRAGFGILEECVIAVEGATLTKKHQIATGSQTCIQIYIIEQKIGTDWHYFRSLTPLYAWRINYC